MSHLPVLLTGCGVSGPKGACTGLKTAYSGIIWQRFGVCVSDLPLLHAGCLGRKLHVKASEQLIWAQLGNCFVQGVEWMG